MIATGGGAFLQEDTRRLILAQTTAIWLDADPRVLADRVRRRDTRPLLRGRDPHTVLSELAAVRNPVYALAPIHIASAKAPHEATVAGILKAIGRGPACDTLSQDSRKPGRRGTATTDDAALPRRG